MNFDRKSDKSISESPKRNFEVFSLPANGAILVFMLLAWGGIIFAGFSRSSLPFWGPGFLSVLLEVEVSFGLLIGMLLIAFILGLAVVRLLIPDALDMELLVFGTAIGLGLLSLLMLLLGVLGLFRTEVIWVLFWGGTLFALYHLVKCEGIQVIQRAFKQTFPKEYSSFDGFLVFVILSGMIFSLAVYVLIPPLNWDEVAYHLAVPKIYIAQQRIVDIPYIVYSSLPLNLEMLYTLALLLGSDILPHEIMFAFSLLSSLAMLVFCTKWFDYRMGLLAVAIYWSMQVVRALSGVALVEMGLGLYAWLAFYAFLEWATCQSKNWLMVSALASGLVAGIKLTGAVIPLILFLILGCVSAWRWHCGQRETNGVAWRILAQFAALAGVLVLPWYIKSFLYTGNPIWPFLNQLFGGQYWDAIGESYHSSYLRITNMEGSVLNFLLGPWYLTLDPGRFGGFDLGRLALWLTPFAPFVVEQNNKKRICLLTLFCGAFYAFWFFMTHQTRFLMPIVPALCVLSASVAWRLISMTPSKVARGVFVGILLLEMPFWDSSQIKLWDDRLLYLTGHSSRTDFLDSHVDAMTAFDYCNQNLEASSKVLLFPYENRGYYLDTPYVWGNLLTQRYIRFEQFDSAEALWQELRSLGITHILDRPAFTHQVFAADLDLLFWEHVRQLMDEVERDYATMVFHADGTFVYALLE